MFYSRLPQAQLNEHQENVLGVDPDHSGLERLKEISPLLCFLFPLPLTLAMDTQGEFLLSSPAKAMTTGEEKMGDITGVTSEK